MSEGKEQAATVEAVIDPMAAFRTREAANDGAELPLYAPTGERTEHWLKVVGADSDIFRDADLRAKREGMKVAAIQDEQERSTATRALQTRLIASAVVAWSFPTPCTLENVIKFLTDAPQIADSVDVMVSRRALFFAKRSIDSMGTPSKSSPST